MSERWVFEVMENGQVVAEGETGDRDTALREAGHYVMMYGQDGGDVKAIVREHTPADLPCAKLPPWSDDDNEHCPFCNAKRGEPCGLEADDE
jgi:hypothetical protein